MSEARRKSREAAVQMLYALQLEPNAAPPNAEDLDKRIAEFWAHFSAPEGAREFADALVRGTAGAVTRLDARLEQSSTHWRLARMAKIDLAILRLAAYELTEAVDVPREVAINEALELAKTFSTEEAAKFVNGVLAGLVKGV